MWKHFTKPLAQRWSDFAAALSLVAPFRADVFQVAILSMLALSEVQAANGNARDAMTDIGWPKFREMVEEIEQIVRAHPMLRHNDMHHKLLDLIRDTFPPSDEPY